MLSDSHEVEIFASTIIFFSFDCRVTLETSLDFVDCAVLKPLSLIRERDQLCTCVKSYPLQVPKRSRAFYFSLTPFLPLSSTTGQLLHSRHPPSFDLLLSQSTQFSKTSTPHFFPPSLAYDRAHFSQIMSSSEASLRAPRRRSLLSRLVLVSPESHPKRSCRFASNLGVVTD